MSLSAAALAVLFGDELGEVGTARIGTTTMPGRDVKVSTKDLATAIIALTAWEGSRSGTVELSIERKKRLGLVPTTSVLVRTTGQPPTGCFAQALVAGAERPTKLDVALRQVLGGDSLDPAGAVLSRVHAELIDAGVLVAEELSKASALGRAMTGKASVVAVPGAADPHRPAWEGLKQAWSTWQAAEPDDATAVLKQAKNALTATTISST